MITMEFGQPELRIREPIESDRPTTRRARRLLAQRRVCVLGAWHLWIQYCTWRVLDQSGNVEGHSDSSKRVLDRVAAFLDGQKLVSVALARPGNRTTFTFDLGGQLETRPSDRSEQWTLFTPGRKVLVLRGDKRYSYHSSNSASDEEWRSTVKGPA